MKMKNVRISGKSHKAFVALSFHVNNSKTNICEKVNFLKSVSKRKLIDNTWNIENGLRAEFSVENLWSKK